MAKVNSWPICLQSLQCSVHGPLQKTCDGARCPGAVGHRPCQRCHGPSRACHFPASEAPGKELRGRGRGRTCLPELAAPPGWQPAAGLGEPAPLLLSGAKMQREAQSPDSTGVTSPPAHQVGVGIQRFREPRMGSALAPKPPPTLLVRQCQAVPCRGQTEYWGPARILRNSNHALLPGIVLF